MRTSILATCLAAPTVLAGGITVTGTTDPETLQNALLGSSSALNVTSFNVAAQQLETLDQPALSTGVFQTSGGNNYGLSGVGIVLSTGDAADYHSGPNRSLEIDPTGQVGWTTNFAEDGERSTPVPAFPGQPGVPASATQAALLNQVAAPSEPKFDVTQIDLSFVIPADAPAAISFDIVFGSEEFPFYSHPETELSQDWADAFGIFLDGTNIATHDGYAINIDHPNMMPLTETELNGVIHDPLIGRSVLTITSPLLDAGSTHELTLIIGDTSDGILDSTVFISNFSAPEPAAGLIVTAALLIIRRR